MANAWTVASATATATATNSMVAMLKTQNLTLNKIALALAYIGRELASLQREVSCELLPCSPLQQRDANGHCLQIAERVLPLLFMFAESENRDSPEGHFAAVLPQLHSAAQMVQELTMLVINLVSQLGALCSEETRKATVISGTASAAARQLTCRNVS